MIYYYSLQNLYVVHARKRQQIMYYKPFYVLAYLAYNYRLVYKGNIHIHPITTSGAITCCIFQEVNKDQIKFRCFSPRAKWSDIPRMVVSPPIHLVTDHPHWVLGVFWYIHWHLPFKKNRNKFWVPCWLFLIPYCQ